MDEVEVTFSIAGSVVTSIDTGVPPLAFEADGSQIDPETYVPYEVGTILHIVKEHTVKAVSNKSTSPIVKLNSSQTWTVRREVLRRESLVFNRPTSFGRYHQPIGWLPVDEISEEWGKIQIIMDGKDVTYFRDHPAEMGSWSSNEPNGDVATSVYFPQISWFEHFGESYLSWGEGGNDVNILLRRPNGTSKTLFEGLVVGKRLEGQGIGVTVDIIGCLFQADHTPYIQELYKKNRDIGNAIADVMDGAVSRHYGKCNRPTTGIRTNIRGSGGARLTQAVQDMLATAFTDDAKNQWTITNYPGRKPKIKLKDKTTHHWSMSMAHPGINLSLTDDFQQSVGTVYGSGTADDGCVWYNAKYPGLRLTVAPPFPLGIGSVFSAGDGDHGFDPFSDEMRTRGYKMYSNDTYSSSDVDEVREMQGRAGITRDGVVGAQTWNAAFGVGGSTPSLAGAHIAPLAQISVNREFLERPDGTIIGRNPSYRRDKLAIGRLVEYGEGVNKIEGTKFARGEIQARLNNDPQWVGSATLSMDPEEGSRWEIKAGQNLFIKFMQPAPSRKGIDDGLLLHISQTTVAPGGDVTVQLSYLGYDMTTLAAIKRRNKDTFDPARRRGMQSRSSRVTKDSVVPWDCEAGGGRIPMHNLQGGFWTIIRIPAGQVGNIVQTKYVCADSLGFNTLKTAFVSEGALSGARAFCIAVFGKPITANFLKGLVGNPLIAESVWTKKAVALEKAGLIQAYGASDQQAGYWPGKETGGTEPDPLTGKLMDGTSWTWESSQPPFLWIAEYCATSTRIAGQLRNAPLGS